MHGRCRNLVGGLRAISFRTAYEKYSEGPHPLHPHPCARHRDPAAPRLRRGKEFFQPNDLVWLDSCDRHRNEGGGDARPLQLSLANTRGNVQPVTQ
ncbi:hypothetical protein CN159_25850 [Sinorhizobium meliloti]|nr:hypothetical protein CN159_25850 [Sinorhizobium meliloti]